MGSRYVAVIDLGKTNSKLALVDTATATELQVMTQAAVVSSTTLYPSIDQKAIESFIIDALSTLSSTVNIDAITVTTHGATVALLDGSGALALPVLDYEFDGVDELREEYDQHRPPFAETGSPALPAGLNIGAQLYWQQSRFNRQFMETHTILTWPQYWVHELTGLRSNDVTSLGCHTDLYEPHRQCFSSLVRKMRWEKLFPPASLPGTFSGNISASFAAATGLKAATPVYTGIHDSNASLVPHLVSRKAPFSVVSTGTWFIVMTIGGKQTTLDEHRDTLLNVNARGESVPSARFMGGRERELLQGSTVTCEHTMEKLLSNSTTPAMLMPSIVPGSGPYPHCTRQWPGEAVNEDAELRNCVITLYLALMTHECMQLTGSDGPTFIEGPLAHDRHFCSMLMAVSNRPVYVSPAQTGTSVGAAMLINLPESLPEYTLVDVHPDRLDKLARYAAIWKRNLLRHWRAPTER